MVEVDRDHIFKFAWHPKANLKSEIRILNHLRGQLGVAIPNPMYVSRDFKFFGYPKIRGHIPRWNETAGWSRGHIGALASDICALTIKIQEAVPARKRKRLLGTKPGVKETKWIDDQAREFQQVFAHSRALVDASKVVFKQYKKRWADLSAGQMKYVGFDLQFDNLLLDESGKLVGILDFGYLTWLDAPGLFGLLYKDDPRLARAVIGCFKNYMGEDVDHNKAKIEGLCSVFGYLVEVSTNRWDMTQRRKDMLSIARRWMRRGVR